MIHRAALALALFAPAAGAQLPPGAGFDWERVGDAPIEAGALAFGPDSLGRPGRYILWAAGGGRMYRLDTTATGGFPGVWVEVNDWVGADRILPLGPDTLVVQDAWVYRSTDGGHTFDLVLGGGPNYKALAEIPPGVPHAGRLLLGSDSGVQFPDPRYSDDRGATWAVSQVPEWGEGQDLAVLPAGSPWAGRVVAASEGAMLSDDGGQTYRPSGLWDHDVVGLLLCVVERPGAPGTVRVLMEGFISGAGGQIWTSDDGGETWAETPMEPGLASPRVLLSLGGPSAVMVRQDGTVERSDDGGETWEAVGRAPVCVGCSARAAAVGPDGRLYVAVIESGPAREWMYRTEDPLGPVAVEPGAEPEPEGLGLEVRPNPSAGGVVVAVTLLRPSEVETSLYDVLGRCVAVLASGRFPAGRHVLTLDGAALPAGVYVVRATAGGAVAAQTVTLLR